MPNKKPRTRNYARSRSRQDAGGSGYTLFVRITKIALPLVALAIIGIVIARLATDTDITQLAERPSQEKTAPGQIELVKARYEGVDAQGRKYTLTADSATRDMASDEAVMLEKPRADIVLDDGGWLAVHADKGRFDNKASKLVLTGGVTAYHDSGYEIHLREIDVDLAARSAASAAPVNAQGPIGELHAQNVAVTERGDLIVFGGPAQMTLHPSRAKPPKGKPG